MINVYRMHGMLFKSSTLKMWNMGIQFILGARVVFFEIFLT